MFGHLGFSYIGLIFLLMLFIPNIIWIKYKPVAYDSSIENKILLIYEIAWFKYFKSERKVKNFYADLYKIPLPLATLPVTAFLLVGVYGNVIWLVISSIILGIGHIGIHIQHLNVLKQDNNKKTL